MNLNIAITSDSTSDLSLELRERYNVGIIPLGVTLGDKNYLDGVDIKPDDIYEHHDFTLTSGYETESQRLDIETYLQMLHNSDKYLGEFIESIKNSNEKTVVLFFGDHSAGVFPAVADSDDLNISTLAHLTPYFIYTNFDIPEDKFAGAMRLVTTTPNCLTNTMFNLLNSEKPVLGYLLDQVCAENPELAPAYFGDDEPNKTPALTNYELVNYDILGGKNYWSKFTD